MAVSTPSTEAVVVTVAGTDQQASITTTTSQAPLLVYSSQGGAPYLMSRRDLLAPTTNERQKFRRLADRWREETFFSSSITNNLFHPAYLKITAMGEKALPLILRELEERGGQWFMALRNIVDEDEYPDKPNDIGKPKELKEAWLEWGHRNDYL